MTYTLDFSLSLGGSKTGLTMAAMVVDTSGGDVGSEVTSGFTEIGEGFYLWNYASVPDAHRGGVKFYEDGVAGTILAFAAINPEEAENLDADLSGIETKVDTIDTNVDDIETDTGTTLPATLSTMDGKIDTLDTVADGIKTVTDVIDDGTSGLVKIASDVAAILVDTATDGVKIGADAIDASALKADAVTEITTSMLTTAMTEAYAADGAAPTLAQALFAIQQFLQERAVSSTTLTVKKLDGSTTALTFTLDSATAPTSITRET